MKIAVVIAIAALAAASAVEAKGRTPVTEKIKDLGVSAPELRIRVRALANPVLGTVEESADAMIAATDVPAMRRKLLLWKIQATTTLMEALLKPDPIVALADAWGYTFQLQDFLDRDAVAAGLGESLPGALRACAAVDEQISRVARGLGPDVHLDQLRAPVKAWAEKHPIDTSLSRREAVDTALAADLARAAGGGAFKALGNLDETMADLTARMDLYAAYLPKQARWEAELFAADVAAGVDPKAVLSDFTRLSVAFDRIATVFEQVPALLERERTAVLEGVTAEHAAAFRDLRGERQVILDAVTRERAATLTDVEGIAGRLTDVSSRNLRAAFVDERRQTLEEIGAMERHALGEVSGLLDAAVDHAFVRALELMLIAFAMLAIGGFIGLRYARGSRTTG